MASKITEKLKVKKLTKYGFQTEAGEYIGWSPKLDESEKGKVVPGIEAEFDLYVSDGGKKYVNGVKILAVVPVKVVKVEPKKEVKSEGMTKEEWLDKDRRISRSGVIQAAIQATGGDFDAAVELAEKMLKFVNDK